MKILLLLLPLFLLSCKDDFTISSLDAQKYELLFKIEKEVYQGHALIYLEKGETQKLRIPIPKGASGYLTINVEDDEEIKIVIDNKEWVEYNIKYNSTVSSISLSLVTKNYDVMIGKIFILQDLSIKDSANVSFNCPYQKNNKFYSVCTRSNNYEFNLTLNVTDTESGIGRITTSRECSSNIQNFNIEGPQQIDFEVVSNDLGICNIRIDTRKKKVNDEWQIKETKIINVNFYDKEYSTLGKPIMIEDDYKYFITSNGYYKSYALNDKIKRVIFPNKDKSITVDKKDYLELQVLVWDKHGRTNFVEGE